MNRLCQVLALWRASNTTCMFAAFLKSIRKLNQNHDETVVGRAGIGRSPVTSGNVPR